MGAKELKQAGLKVTLPRMKILKTLQHPESPHLTAEVIHRTVGRVRRGDRAADGVSGFNPVPDGWVGQRHHFRGRPVGVRTRFGRAP